MEKNRIEYVLWATRKGDEDWQEELITTADTTQEGQAKLDKAKAWAEQQGFDRFRVSKNDCSVAPDFARVVRK